MRARFAGLLGAAIIAASCGSPSATPSSTPTAAASISPAPTVGPGASPSPGQTATPTASPEPAAEGRWETTGPMALARGLPRAVLLGDGTVIVVGNDDEGGCVRADSVQSETWDPASGTWSAGPSLNAPRADFAAVAGRRWRRARDGRRDRGRHLAMVGTRTSTSPTRARTSRTPGPSPPSGRAPGCSIARGPSRVQRCSSTGGCSWRGATTWTGESRARPRIGDPARLVSRFRGRVDAGRPDLRGHGAAAHRPDVGHCRAVRPRDGLLVRHGAASLCPRRGARGHARRRPGARGRIGTDTRAAWNYTQAIVDERAYETAELYDPRTGRFSLTGDLPPVDWSPLARWGPYPVSADGVVPGRARGARRRGRAPGRPGHHVVGTGAGPFGDDGPHDALRPGRRMGPWSTSESRRTTLTTRQPRSRCSSTVTLAATRVRCSCATGAC